MLRRHQANGLILILLALFLVGACEPAPYPVTPTGITLPGPTSPTSGTAPGYECGIVTEGLSAATGSSSWTATTSVGPGSNWTAAAPSARFPETDEPPARTRPPIMWLGTCICGNALTTTAGRWNCCTGATGWIRSTRTTAAGGGSCPSGPASAAGYRVRGYPPGPGPLITVEVNSLALRNGPSTGNRVIAQPWASTTGWRCWAPGPRAGSQVRDVRSGIIGWVGGPLSGSFPVTLPKAGSPESRGAKEKGPADRRRPRSD